MTTRILLTRKIQFRRGPVGSFATSTQAVVMGLVDARRTLSIHA
ncbi:hypothetical protein ACQPXT_34195 [Streptomyces sp. CA-100214]